MALFFTEQLDFIYFIYGFSFIALGVICFLIRNEKKDFDWLWLGLFGFTHGINEWLELIAISLLESKEFLILRTLILALSFIFLLEFSINSAFNNQKKQIRLIYLSIIFLITLNSLLFGASNFKATTRYFVGFPSALFTALLFFSKIPSSENKTKKFLCLSGIGFVVYSFATGLVTPKLNLSLANTINYDSFLQALGFPVQLLRTACAITITLAIYNYILNTAKLFNEKQYSDYQNYFKKFSLKILLSLCLVILCGWILCQSLGNYSKNIVITDSRKNLSLISNYLQGELSKIEEAAQSISGSPWIVGGLTQEASDIEKANTVLDRYNKAFNMSVCYLLNKEGKAIASSNRFNPDSFIGKDYSFRPYFKEALSGKLGKLFALGVTSYERGYYASFPVRNAQGFIIGAVAIKKNLNEIEKYFSNYKYTFLVSPLGIVFSSGNKEFIFHTLWPINEETLNLALSSREFGDKILPSILDKAVFNENEIDFKGKRFFVAQKQINNAGWYMVLLNTENLIFEYRFFAIVITIILTLLVVIFAVIIWQKQKFIFFESMLNKKLKDEISERKKTEEELKTTQNSLIQSEKMAALGRFASGLAHEIKNPLGIILGGVEALEKKLRDKSEEIKDVLSKIAYSTDRANTIVQNLLKFARPSKLEFEKTDVNEVLKETLALINFSKNLKGIILEISYLDKDGVVLADKNQLQQVFFNCINNGIEAMPNGGRLTIKVNNIRDEKIVVNGRVILIEIKDTGIGISKEELEQIFEPFFTTKLEKKGTGLGLFISKTILDNHKGQISVESGLKEGTTVKIYLPAA